MRNQKTIPCSSVCIRGPFTVAAETRVGRFCAGQLPPRTTEKHGNNDRGITRINTDEKSENNPCSSVFIRGPFTVAAERALDVSALENYRHGPRRNTETTTAE